MQSQDSTHKRTCKGQTRQRRMFLYYMLRKGTLLECRLLFCNIKLLVSHVRYLICPKNPYITFNIPFDLLKLLYAFNSWQKKQIECASCQNSF